MVFFDPVSLGVRWQSLIVAPKMLPWMKLRPVPPEGKFRWWSSLREVPSSAVTSRGETERFLYYDGPTREHSPVKVKLADGNLRFTQQWHRTYGDNDELLPGPARTGLYLRVSEGNAAAYLVHVPGVDGVVHLGQPSAAGEGAAEAELSEMLVEAGLNDAEAAGLIDCWRGQFFRTPGRRFLLLMTREDYDRTCPLTVRPEPTQIARVGIVLTEFGKE